MSEIAISEIRIDGGTQSRGVINDQIVSDYAEAIQAGEKFPPVVVYFDGAAYWLADGFHRYHAYASANIEAIPADVRQGTQRDAILFSVGANASHGLRRTSDDKRRAVLTLLNDKEWSKWSANHIAKQCGVSHTFVNGLKSSLETVSSEPRKYTTKHGAQAEMKTANIGASTRKTPALAPPLELVEAIEPDAPASSQDQAEVKLRREFRAMTKEGQEDAYVGLKFDLQDCKTVTAKLRAERDSLKQQVKDLSATDSGAVIRRLQQDVNNANNKRWKEGEKTKHALKTAYAAKKELKALGREEIPL